jgi:hypothetical protein
MIIKKLLAAGITIVIGLTCLACGNNSEEGFIIDPSVTDVESYVIDYQTNGESDFINEYGDIEIVVVSKDYTILNGNEYTFMTVKELFDNYDNYRNQPILITNSDEINPNIKIMHEMNKEVGKYIDEGFGVGFTK